MGGCDGAPLRFNGGQASHHATAAAARGPSSSLSSLAINTAATAYDSSESETVEPASCPRRQFIPSAAAAAAAYAYAAAVIVLTKCCSCSTYYFLLFADVDILLKSKKEPQYVMNFDSSRGRVGRDDAEDTGGGGGGGGSGREVDDDGVFQDKRTWENQLARHILSGE